MAGDTIIIRGGVWTERMDFQAPVSKTGTAGNYITVAGHPGETVIFRYTSATEDSYGPIRARGDRGYFIFENLVLDGVNETNRSGWQIRDGNHDFILRDLEIKNFKFNGLFIGASNITVQNCHIHDQVSLNGEVVGSGERWYGVYIHDGTNIVIENSRIAGNPGGKIQAYNGSGPSLTNVLIRNNEIYENNTLFRSPNAGVEIFRATGQAMSGIQIYNNAIYNNAINQPADGTSNGVRVANGPADTKIWNNVIYGNKGVGVSVLAATNTEVNNNIIFANTVGQVTNSGTNTSITHNACGAADSCGTTEKVSTTVTACITSTSPFDGRLIQGTNPCRNAGTSTAARPAPVGATDIGAFEQGRVVSAAALAGGGIEATVDVMTPGVLPTSGITGFSAACVGCSGSPTVSAASVKEGTDNIVHLAIEGITKPGSCTISLGPTNMTDSLFVGPTGPAQGVESVSALAVEGPCVSLRAQPKGRIHPHG